MAEATSMTTKTDAPAPAKIRPMVPRAYEPAGAGDLGPPTPGPANSGPAVPAGRSPVVRGVEGPVSDRPATSDALIEAAGMVYRLLTDRIAWHESEAARLREALIPFGEVRQPAAAAAPPDEVIMRSLLDFAARHGVK